ncbi:pyruvate kinase [Flagellimonas sp. HMM57]|uniref:pyruvate kinase n=1 Tax=unclassified Flagellimonas TaxID=2644544 RepID=UPI0013D3F5C3|nr:MULTISPECIES: pyruvate kinase [unclassified Flagellimonas]UII74684.1 pyruvate kinase [Flagellimonas sp. HMM57]
MSMSFKEMNEISLRIESLIAKIEEQDTANREILKNSNPVYKKSARNLLHYGTFRSFDVRKIQAQLKYLGLTRLANSEGNILGSLVNVKTVIDRLNLSSERSSNHDCLSIGEGSNLLKKHTNNLFGARSEDRRVRIMVTQPTKAAHDYNMVLEMVKSGMDCARINCAHDNAEIWKDIVLNIKKAALECGTTVKIAMDLAGPKIRTGNLLEGSKVKKFKPKRTAVGIVESPAHIELVPDTKGDLGPNEIPVSNSWMTQLQERDFVALKDTRSKFRKLQVVKVKKDRLLLSSEKTVYIGTGTKLFPMRSDLDKGIVGELPVVARYITLRKDDLLIVSGKDEEGSLSKFDKEGRLIQPGKISCIPHSVVKRVKKGEPILFDDGKIKGIIEDVSDDFFMVRIKKAKENGSKLKAEKGINFPTLDMGINGLTAKDKKDLEFVAQYADIVNYSYINTEADVVELLDEMERLNIKDKISIILKIETRFAFRNLVKILLAAMKTKYLGIMIARGDLALEVGWKNMSKVQEEILSFCGAAHIPVVWATQVLESLAKNGLPSRSEIADTASSVRAECVMLNKGPYINEAIKLLDEILHDMERLHEKKEGMWPKIEWL